MAASAALPLVLELITLFAFITTQRQDPLQGMLTAKRSPVVHPLKGCEGTATERDTVGSHNEEQTHIPTLVCSLLLRF